MAERDRQRCRTSCRVSRPAKSDSIRAPPSEKALSEAVCRDVEGHENRTMQAENCRSGNAEKILTLPVPQEFGDVAARRALCRIFLARVASLPQRTRKPAVRGFVGKRARGRKPRFWVRRGGSILVQDKAMASSQVTPSRNAGRRVTDSGCFADFGRRFGDYRVTSLLRVRCHL